MQTSFTDLVGTAAVHVHCFGNDELTELTPVLHTARAVYDLAAEADEGSATRMTVQWCYTGVISTC
jgi:hypothetical protein